MLTLWTISVRNRAMNWNIIAASTVAMMQLPVFCHLWVQSFDGHSPPSLYRLSSAVSHRLVWCDRCPFRNTKSVQCMHRSCCYQCHCRCWCHHHFPSTVRRPIRIGCYSYRSMVRCPRAVNRPVGVAVRTHGTHHCRSMRCWCHWHHRRGHSLKSAPLGHSSCWKCCER